MFRAALTPGIVFGLLAGLYPRMAQATDYLRGAYAGGPTQQGYATEAMPSGYVEGANPRSTFRFDWGGVYGGAFTGASLVQNTPTSAHTPVITGLVPTNYGSLVPSPNGPFPNVSKVAPSFGAFAGINYLWDDVVMGVEVDYTHTTSKAKADSVVGPAVFQSSSTNPQYILNNTREVRVRPSNWGTIRGRVGYAAGMFMPFVTMGVAMGLVDTRTRSYGTWTERNTSTGAIVSSGSYNAVGGKNSFLLGGAFGAGIEAQIMPGAFLRAEWQAVKFARPAGGTTATIHTGRIGGGVKF